jgi:hypothetical protein
MLLLSEFRFDDHEEFGMGDPTIIVAPPPELTLLFFPCHHRCVFDFDIIGKQVYSHRADLAINDKQAYSTFCLKICQQSPPLALMATLKNLKNYTILLGHPTIPL